jgi:hypothetical protein
VRLDAAVLQFGNHGEGVAAQAIAEGKASLQATIPRKKDDRATFGLPLASDQFGASIDEDGHMLDQAAASDKYAFVVVPEPGFGEKEVAAGSFGCRDKK